MGLRFSALPGGLLAGLRTQPIVGHERNYRGWHRSMSRVAYVREAPGQPYLIETSLFQPTNIPAKVQVDINPEYSWWYRTNLGFVGYLERIPYTQGGKGRSVMQPVPRFTYTVQAPRFSTLPTVLGVGG